MICSNQLTFEIKYYFFEYVVIGYWSWIKGYQGLFLTQFVWYLFSRRKIILSKTHQNKSDNIHDNTCENEFSWSQLPHTVTYINKFQLENVMNYYLMPKNKIAAIKILFTRCEIRSFMLHRLIRIYQSRIKRIWNILFDIKRKI